MLGGRMRAPVLRCLPPALALGAAALLTGSAARADRPRVTIELTYVRGPGAADCPDTQGFRKTVSRQMDGDPFDPGGRLRLRASVERIGAELVGTMELRDEIDLVWERRLKG